MITNEFKRVKFNSHRLGGKKKPNQLDVQKLVLKEARRIEKNCGTFPPTRMLKEWSILCLQEQSYRKLPP